MSPRSVKPLERTPGTLFEREELPSDEVIDGCVTAASLALQRLQHVLEISSPSAFKRVPRRHRMALLFENARLTYWIRHHYPPGGRR